jgi:hypothetical protein
MGAGEDHAKPRSEFAAFRNVGLPLNNIRSS